MKQMLPSLMALTLTSAAAPTTTTTTREPVVQIAELSIDPAQLPAYERALRTEIRNVAAARARRAVVAGGAPKLAELTDECCSATCGSATV